MVSENMKNAYIRNICLIIYRQGTFITTTTTVPLASLTLAAVCAAGFGMLASRYSPMSFYQRPAWLFFLYGLPALGGIVLVHHVLARRLPTWPLDWLENGILIEMNVFWALLTALLTWVGVDSAVMFTTMTLFGFPLRYFAERLFPQIKSSECFSRTAKSLALPLCQSCVRPRAIMYRARWITTTPLSLPHESARAVCVAFVLVGSRYTL